jgi:hypothetical protein
MKKYNMTYGYNMKGRSAKQHEIPPQALSKETNGRGNTEARSVVIFYFSNVNVTAGKNFWVQRKE